MRTKLVWISGSLLGGMIVHFVIAGCSSRDMTTGVSAALVTPPAMADDVHPLMSMKTADTDGSQLRRGVVPINAPSSKLASGPFVLTDFQAQPDNPGAGEFVIFTATGTVCPDSPTTDVIAHLPASITPTITTGARFFVPAGSVLCTGAPPSSRVSGLSWAGFVPYP